MNIKMIVTDLDRTLLHTDETISDYSLNVLKRYHEAGIKIVYATGRGGRSAKSVATSELFDGGITQSGAVIVVDESIMARYTIPLDKVRSMLNSFYEYGLNAMAEDDRHYYGSKKTYDFVTNGWTSPANFIIVDLPSIMIEAEKINVFVYNQDDIDFVRSNLYDHMYLTVARDGHGMILRDEATKATAVAKLAELWGIESKEIISFGDDMIDIDVLAYSGIGVAVSNAIDEVKAVADYVCDTNDNDGVAKWLEENVIK